MERNARVSGNKDLKDCKKADTKGALREVYIHAHTDTHTYTHTHIYKDKPIKQENI